MQAASYYCPKVHKKYVMLGTFGFAAHVRFNYEGGLSPLAKLLPRSMCPHARCIMDSSCSEVNRSVLFKSGKLV